MSDEKQEEKLSDLDKAINTLSDLLDAKQETEAGREMFDFDEDDVPVLSDVVNPEDELEQVFEPPVLRRDEHLIFRLHNEEVMPAVEQESTGETAPAPMATEELLRELEGIVEQELEKVTRTARESIMGSLKSRLDARQDEPTGEVTEEPLRIEAVSPDETEHPVYLPMSNWKKDEDDEFPSLSLFGSKRDD
jgi:hypothetical protein